MHVPTCPALKLSFFTCRAFSAADSVTLAVPKSASFTMPSWSSRLLGFMSRWAIFALWRKQSPSRIWRVYLLTTASQRAPHLRMACWTLPPAQYSMKTKRCFLLVSVPKYCTMFGCSKDLSISISFCKLFTTFSFFLLPALAPGALRLTHLTANSEPKLWANALYTFPKAPFPRRVPLVHTSLSLFLGVCAGNRLAIEAVPGLVSGEVPIEMNNFNGALPSLSPLCSLDEVLAASRISSSFSSPS
mmetsp:Transcript_11664/g.23547  ORF Transcript_11664/g.23547 Transcript_11664/m.23547 type:complete len:245 (+) Transcript_11664:541-1275(+)